ncbi:MAG: cell division protein FtsL [Aestuariivita sp.]|nr:cell division protein FtsL [Aestuariivita sp.]MCY4202396.1 cell division protein FtsL [Aestuariivita sp.]MCY4288665.1 cell division protein FtsL [Aestuariivita sp.]MCY4345564.1 cell division protein FtsL [Aestuariivita sp.]
MKSLLYFFAAIVVSGLVYWAYGESYKTQIALEQRREVQREIGITHARLSVLRAEWAYLNRPDRLRELAQLNFEKLALQPLRPNQFGRIAEVAFPPKDQFIVTRLVELLDQTTLSSPATERQ